MSQMRALLVVGILAGATIGAFAMALIGGIWNVDRGFR